jgi:hypothetical protein
VFSERSLFILLMLVKLITITVWTSFHNYYITCIPIQSKRSPHHYVLLNNNCIF